MTQQEQTKKITLSYLLITFAIMGLTWGGISIAQQYGYLKNNSTMFYLLYILGGASTTIASFISLTRAGVSPFEWLKNVFGIKQKPIHYFVVLFLLCSYIGTGLLTKNFKLAMPLVYLFLYTFTSIMEGGLEESGWRYILQPNLEKMMPFSLATLLTSAIWGLWHVPLFFMAGTSQQNMNFGAFFLLLISFSFSLAVIRKLTKSVWLCVLFHAALNAACTVFAVELNSINTVIFSLSMVLISLSLLKIEILHYKE